MRAHLVRAAASAALLVPAALVLTAATPAAARNAGPPSSTAAVAAGVVIAGRVTDAATGQPIEGVQVLAVGPRIGMTTAATGRYRLVLPAGVRGGTVTVQARRIGYSGLTKQVRADADSIALDFALPAASTKLMEVVVTGQPAPLIAPGVTGFSATVPGPVVSRGAPGRGARDNEPNTESYDRITDNPFLAAAANPLSTFSIDVDRASYSNVRRFIDVEKRLPPKDAVRIEELINYFHYDYPEPNGAEPFAVATEVAAAPWNPAHRLVRIGLQGRRIAARDLPPSNLVFLIDVSGSMESPDKLPLLKSAFALLVDQLREQDRVAIVVYAGAAGLVLPSTPGSDKPRIMAALEELQAGGSTAGGAGIKLAYEVAREHHVAGGNNRVILATDGDFNVGASSDAEMVRLIEERRGQGTFLTVLGFGTGNLKDSKMEQLADHGNGSYAYVDNLMEARKVLVHELGGTLLAIAKDVKLQVEFNPARVAAYRLIGYENRLLRAEDFADDRKDAGELGAGHSVTALYEVVPPDAPDADRLARGRDSLRYQRPAAPRPGAQGSGELLYVKLRYKQPDESRSRLLEYAVADRASERPSEELTFAAAVAAFGMILRESEHRGSATIGDVIAMATRSRGRDPGGYRADFIRLAGAYSELRSATSSTATAPGNR